jgi:hypothetical protein
MMLSKSTIVLQKGSGDFFGTYFEKQLLIHGPASFQEEGKQSLRAAPDILPHRVWQDSHLANESPFRDRNGAPCVEQVECGEHFMT